EVVAADLDPRAGVGLRRIPSGGYEVLGVLPSPCMVGSHVVRDEIQDEADAAPPQRLSSRGQPGVASDAIVDSVLLDAVGGAGEVAGPAVGKHGVAGGADLRILLGDAPALVAASPHSHEPHGVNARQHDLVPVLVAEISEPDRLAEP